MNYKPEDQAKLTCFYWSGYDPYLIWQPYKAEMLWHSPQIVQFYDVLNDREMDAIVAMGRPQLKWATGTFFPTSVPNVNSPGCSGPMISAQRQVPKLSSYVLLSPRSRNGNPYQRRL